MDLFPNTTDAEQQNGGRATSAVIVEYDAYRLQMVNNIKLSGVDVV